MKTQNILSIFLALLLVSTVTALPSIETQKVSSLTIRDGDEYFCQDPNDPDLVWNLDQIQQGLLIVENEFVKNDDTDDPVGEGETYTLPNDYAKISFDEQIGAESAKVSIRDRRDNILDSTTVYAGDPIVKYGLSGSFRLDRGSLLVLGTDSPSIESAETSNDDDYGNNLFMEVTRANIKAVSLVNSLNNKLYGASVLGNNLRFKINDNNSLTLVGRIPSCH